MIGKRQVARAADLTTMRMFDEVKDGHLIRFDKTDMLLFHQQDKGPEDYVALVHGSLCRSR